MKAFAAFFLAACLSLHAQQPAKPAAAPPALTGEWEIFLGERGTGIVINVVQSGDTLTGTYQEIPANNRYGIRPGFDFFTGNVGGSGSMTVRKGDVTKGKPVEKEQAPFQFKLSEDGQRLSCTVQSESIRKAEREFQLVRQSQIKNLRLFVQGPGELQPATKIIEGLPMVIEVEMGSATQRPVEITLVSGKTTLKLMAKPVETVAADAEAPAGPRPTDGHLRTESFLPVVPRLLGENALPPNAAAEKPPEGREMTFDDLKELQGVWRTIYKDEVLNTITGWASFDERGKVRLRYQQPADKEWKELQLTSSRVLGEIAALPAKPAAGDEPAQPARPALPKLKFVFEGAGVTSTPVKRAPDDKVTKFTLDGEAPEPIKITASEISAQVGLKRSDLPDLKKVTLELGSREPNGVLLWNWHYHADRATARDREGLGRVGVMQRMEGDEESSLGKMSGREAWLRQPPQIVTAFALEDQLAADTETSYDGQPKPKYRLGEKKRRVSLPNGKSEEVTVYSASGNLTRTIFIIARGLPPDDTGKLTLDIGDGSGVTEYRIQARDEEKYATDAKLRKAWEDYRATQQTQTERRISDGTPAALPAKGESVDKEEGIIALAIIASKSPPKPQKFKLNGADGEWQLLYGDTTGQFAITRTLAPSHRVEGDNPAEKGEHESTGIVFVPEQLRLSVHVTNEVPAIDHIDAVIAMQDVGAPVRDMQKIVLKPDPNDKSVYLSPPIELVREADFERFKDQAGAVVLVGKKGGVLRAQVADDSGYAIWPPSVQAKVETTPANLNALWKDAVKRAADLAGKPVQDWNAVARGDAGAATNFILTEMSFRSLKIRIGDHAAMLLLRPEFIQMMREQIAQWQRNQGESAMRGMFNAQKAAIGAQQSPMSFIRVPVKELPGYQEGANSRFERLSLFFREEENPPLHMLFDEASLSGKMRIDKSDPAFAELQWQAFKRAYREWGAKMNKAVADAQNTADGNVLGLLKLTGMGFEPVVERLVPKLMKMEDDTTQMRGRWVPDRVARAHVISLGVLGAAVRAQEEYSEADTRVVQMTAALASVALGNIGGIWAAAGGVALSTADVAYAVVHDGFMNTGRRDDLEFEIGAGAVLGSERAADAAGKVLSTTEQVISIGGSMLGLAGDSAALRGAIKQAKNLKFAQVAERTTEILKNIDIADPKALRALSMQDKAILARFVEEAEKAAKTGLLTDVSKETEAVLKNRRNIFEALEEGSEAQKRLAASMTKVTESPPLALTRTEIDQAGKNLDTLIKQTDEEIAALKAAKPADGTAEAKRLDDLKGQIGDLKQRRTVVTAYQEPTVKLPERTAAILAGEADDITDAERAAVNTTKELVRKGNKYVRDAADAGVADGLTDVNLAGTKRRLDDLAGQTASRINELETAGKKVAALETAKAAPEELAAARKSLADLNPKPGELEAARKRLASLQENAKIVEEMNEGVRNTSLAKVSTADAELLNGKRLQLTDLDRAQVEKAILDAGGDWKKIVQNAKGTADQQLLMHKVAAYRREMVHKYADEVIEDVNKLTGKKELFRDAFGSSNLSSDYDVAFRGPGAEIAVEEFNKRIRHYLGGRESGGVLDNNFYTDPVYNIFKASELTGSEGKLTRAQFDTSRQFLFQQMANAKYREPGQLAAFRERLLKGVPENLRGAMADVLDQAQGANELAKARVESRITQRLTDLGKDVSNTELRDLERLRVTNELYGNTLGQINSYRKFVEHLDEVKAGKALISSAPVPPLLKDTELGKHLATVQEMLSNPATKKAGLEAMDQLRSRAIVNMRNQQGLALSFASEAYQAGDTIKHVVGELQAGGIKVKPDDIFSGIRRESQISKDGYVNSFYENGANLIKELNGKHIIDHDTGELLAGMKADKLEAGATKSAKYFVRQIDAAHMSGTDLTKAGIPDVEKLVRATVDLDAARDSAAKFNDVLKKLGWSHEEYVRRVLAADKVLEGQVVGNSTLMNFANDLHSMENTGLTVKSVKDLPGLTDFTTQFGKRLTVLSNLSRGGRTLTRAQQAEHDQLASVANAQRDLERAAEGARLAGMPQTEIDRALQGITDRADPAAWRQKAAQSLQDKTRVVLRAPSNVPADAPAALPAATRTALKLPDSSTASPETLERQLRESNRHVTSIGSATPPDVLQSHLAGNRTVLTQIDLPDRKGRAWVRVEKIDGNTVRADDPTTGQPIEYSTEVFRALTHDQSRVMIIDPYRTADGKLQQPKEFTGTLPDLDQVMPVVR